MTTVTHDTQTDKGWRAVNLDMLRSVEDLPSLSSVVIEFLELSRREYFTATDFEKVISKDQALVARLLRVANSALYGSSRNVRSIPESVVLLGLDSIKKIVLAVSAEGLTRASLPRYQYKKDRGFWMHSMAVGLAARSLSESMSDKPMHSEEAFTAGLLHDVGKLILNDYLDDKPGRTRVMPADETEATGLDHTELGEYILKQWRLPESTVAAIRDHHADLQQPDVDRGARVLQLAQAIVGTWGVGYCDPVDLGPDFDPAPHGDLIAVVGLPRNKLDQVVWDIRQELSKIDQLYKD